MTCRFILLENALIEDVLDVDAFLPSMKMVNIQFLLKCQRHSNAYSVVERIISDIQKVDNPLLTSNV